MLDSLLDKLKIGKEKPNDTGSMLDKLKTDIEPPKIKNVGWYNEAAFEDAMNAYMKSGFRNNGTRPDKDTRKIWDTRKPHDNLKDIGGVLKWLDTGLKGASDLTGNLFHVPLTFSKRKQSIYKKR